MAKNEGEIFHKMRRVERKADQTLDRIDSEKQKQKEKAEENRELPNLVGRIPVSHRSMVETITPDKYDPRYKETRVLHGRKEAEDSEEKAA